MALQDLWDSVKTWANQPGAHQVRAAIPPDRTDLEKAPEALVPHRSYFRLWLTDMFLSQQRAWFVNWQPMVHSLVKLKFGDRDGVHLASVAQPSSAAAGASVLLNYRLTELLPFNGGTVELEAALLGLKGANHLQPAVKILQMFSGMVAVPLAPVLGMAEKLAAGVQEVMNASNGEVVLALHDTLRTNGGPQGLAPGYVAIVNATEADVAPERLSVKAARLYYEPFPGSKLVPFASHDYMLFFVESTNARDDWRLKTIQDPLDQAIGAFIAGEKEKADAYRKVALTAALTSPDLTVADRNRAALAVRDELKNIEAMGLGAVGGENRSLDDLVKAHGAGPASWSAVPLTFDELVA